MLIQSTLPPKAPKKVSLPPQVESTPENEESRGPLSGQAGERIGHFVRGVTMEGLQHLRYLSAANAFQKVGSTVGSLALTPLAIRFAQNNAPLIGGLAIGGTVVAGALGAVAGYAWLHHRDGKNKGLEAAGQVSDAVLNAGAALQTLPKFVYPSVSGATPEQVDLIYNALDKLPLHQATASATMEVVPDLLDTGISGMAQPGDSHVHILLDQSRMESQRWGTELVLHEQAHAVDYSGGFGLLGAHNWRGGFGKEPFVSNYAESNRYEDFAESFESYVQDPEGFAQEFPDKAASIERLSQTDPLSGSVDQPHVRDAGKKIGATLGKVPLLRTGLELAGSLMAPVMLHRGAGKLSEGLATGDEAKKLDGKLNLATGLFLSLPGARPLAFGSAVAGTTIRSLSKENKEEHMKAANSWADKVLATSAGPVGMTAAAVTQELKANGLGLDESSGFTAAGWQDARPGKGAMLKGTLATVGGTVAGSVLGAALGGAVSGSGGAIVGALWGQMAGGAIGLAGYSVHRVLSESKKERDPLALTAADRKFLGKTVGGAVVGGTAGTLAAGAGGRLLGTTVGQAIGDPALAGFLGSLGGWVGGLAGAYGGAKLGAGLGSGRLLGVEG